MGLGVPRAGSYIKNWRNELSYVIFINQFLWSVLRVLFLPLLKTIQKIINRNNWDDLLEANQYIDNGKWNPQSPTKKCKWINPMILGAPRSESYLCNLTDEMSYVMYVNKLFWSVLSFLLLVLLNLIQKATNLKNWVWLTWRQSVYQLQQVKSQHTHQNLGKD